MAESRFTGSQVSFVKRERKLNKFNIYYIYKWSINQCVEVDRINENAYYIPKEFKMPDSRHLSDQHKLIALQMSFEGYLR